jgi:hypothetical protein
MSWLEALKNLDTETTLESEVDADAAFSSAKDSESPTQQGDKSARSPSSPLLAPLSPPHIRKPESHAYGQGCREKNVSTRVRPWLAALRSLEERISEEEEKRTARMFSSSVDGISEAPVQRGAKRAESPPSSDGEGTSVVNTADAKPKEVRRTLVTNPEQLAETIVELRDVDLVALDLETTGLDPRRDSIRLLSLATKDTTYIVDCQSVDLAELLPALTKKTLVAHNALFDLSFLSSLGFVPGKVADTMILSQLLHAGTNVEPLKRGLTSHSLDSVVKRELGLELDKTHQSGDWGGAPLRPR